MSTTDASGNATDALVERLFMATVDTLEVASIHVGGRLGFYRALAEGGPTTPRELASITATAERYVREWLEQQAVAGFLGVENGRRRRASDATRFPRSTARCLSMSWICTTWSASCSA